MVEVTSLEERAEKVLGAFLAKHPDYVGDAKVYSAEAWRRRGEPYGRNSLATLVLDGSPLHRAFNNAHLRDHEVVASLNRDLAEFGMYWELGFAWSLHIYKE